MTFSGIWAVFRKEMVDTLRDRKTLVFMLLLPTLMTPLLMFGIGRLMQEVQKREEVRVVRIVADERARVAWRGLVHRWFLGTELGGKMKIVDTPVLGALLRNAAGADAAKLPEGTTRDPEAFETWIRGLAPQVRDNLDSIDEQPVELMEQLTPEMRAELIDFYRVAIKGFALVEFVDPSALAPAPADYAPPHMTEAVAAIPAAGSAAWAIAARDVQGLLHAPQGYEGAAATDDATATLAFVHDSTVPLSREALARFETVVGSARDAIVRERLAGRGIAPAFLEPVRLADDTDLASPQKRALNAAGSILPYLVIVFAFLGGLYPAIDMGAGEKERNTLETLLCSPVARADIALGKFFVILVASLTASTLGVASLALSYQFIIPQAVIDLIQLKIDPVRMIPVALLAVPAAASFAGVFLAVSIFARSFKEAQNYIAPLQFLLILPAIAPMLPGVEMSWRLALVPLVNVSVLMRDFLKGETNWAHYGLTLATCVALAALCVAYCVRQFNREEVLFRT